MNPTQPDKTISPEPATMSEARRKLIRAGLATGPVIATLASPSVFATNNCVAPSQTLSAAQSHAATQLGSCDKGDSAATWATNIASSSYSGPGASLRNKPFHDIFTVQGSSTTTRMFMPDPTTHVARAMTFFEVLQDPSRAVARDFVAAYLNISTKNIQFPVNGIKDRPTSLQAIVNMWNEWARTGFYTPYAGASTWDSTRVTYYLANFVPGP